ncbi:MAG: N-(5'-phosphoribosyl)anthranilate isomerase [Phycisphaerales bacterium JB060]
MGDRVRIKICGLTTTNMVDTAVEAGVDAVGVVLSPSKRQVMPGRAATLFRILPGFVAGVAVYRHPDADLVPRALEALPPWTLHQSDADDFDGTLGAVPNDRRVPVVRLGATFERDIARHERRMVLIEGQDSGSGEAAPWHEAGPWIPRCRVIIAGGLSIKNVGEVVRTLRPFAVDVSSGVEREPGIKDAGMVREFIAAVREGERE